MVISPLCLGTRAQGTTFFANLMQRGALKVRKGGRKCCVLSLSLACIARIVALLHEQQRELNISPSLDGLHFPALVSAETHVVVEDVAVACIQFSQQRTSWALTCAEYGVWPDIVRKDSQEHLVFAITVEQSVHLHEV